jgi:hypothetical protein
MLDKLGKIEYNIFDSKGTRPTRKDQPMATRIEVQARKAATIEDFESARSNVDRLISLSIQMMEMGLTEIAARYEGEAFGVANRLGLARELFPERFASDEEIARINSR